jgi:hypothetical protein
MIATDTDIPIYASENLSSFDELDVTRIVNSLVLTALPPAAGQSAGDPRNDPEWAEEGEHAPTRQRPLLE